MKAKKHRFALSDEEVIALISRVETLCPAEFTLHTFVLLRGIYARLLRLRNE